jgi:hypothetical protein
MHSEENPVSQPKFITEAIIESISDTFSIHPVYRDPFLGKRLQQNEMSEGSAKKTVQTIPIVKAATPWPVIVYSGIIKNQKLNKEMILLQIDGQDFMMKQGEIRNGLQLFKVTHDSIEVHFSKEKKIIYK